MKRIFSSAVFCLLWGISVETAEVGGSGAANGWTLGTSGVAITDILDEDTMSSDSATALATQQSIKAYVDAAGGGGVSRWSTWTGASRTDDDTISSTTHYEAGTPIRYRATSGTWRYGIITARSTNAHDLDGHPCSTSDDDEFQVGNFPGDQVKVVNLVMPGNCSVADPFSAELYWQQLAAFLVRTTARADTAPAGSALELNTEVNDADVHSSEVSITAGSTNEFDSGVNITVANYDIQFGEKYHISTSQCGSSTPGGNPLTVTLTFIIP